MAFFSRIPSAAVDPAPLGLPVTYKHSGRTARNRFLKAAMSEQISSWDPTDLSARGIPSKEVINVYQRWGEGGFGHILTGNIMVAYDQLESPGNLIIAPDAAPCEGSPRFEAWKELASQAKKQGSLISGQVSHPGRQTDSRLQANPISASDVQLQSTMGKEFAKPRPASQEDIDAVIEAFVHAAQYLQAAGFDGIQLHAAHGYLLAQFLSKTTNKRTDEYGGSLRNRARITLQIADAIREKLPGFILGIKINSVEFQDQGFTPPEAVGLCALLEEAKFDWVELSGGTYEDLGPLDGKRASTREREGFFLEFAEMIKLRDTKIYITGGLRTVQGMVAALSTVDGVGLGRPAAQEFSLPNAILQRKVTGAIEQQVDQSSFGLTTMVAGTQIGQVGKDQQPINMGIKENASIFLKSFGTFMQELAQGVCVSVSKNPCSALSNVFQMQTRWKERAMSTWRTIHQSLSTQAQSRSKISAFPSRYCHFSRSEAGFEFKSDIKIETIVVAQ
jgi:2,4-dienoyl-CoA reductase-like NADH-dependent reductase (Old Yellow Enzyme family)